MTCKRGQITLFILVGMITLIIFAFVLFLREPRVAPVTVSEETLANNPEVDSFVSACLKKTAEDGIIYISARGGYYDAPEPSSELFAKNISYYWFDSRGNVPSISVLESELSKYIDSSIRNCTGDFESLAYAGYSIEAGEPSSEVNIGKDSVIVSLDYPISATKGMTTFKNSRFIQETQSEIYSDHEVAGRLMEMQEQRPDSVMLGALMKLALEENLRFDIVDIGDGVYMYSLMSDEWMKGSTLRFNFLAKYNWEEL